MIDTSNRFLSVGIAKEGKLVYKTQYEAWQRQSEFTVAEVEKAFTKVGITAKDLTGIAVSRGPGSYTGLRIALTVGKVMAYALHIPLMAFSSLQVLAGTQEDCLVLMDARSDRAYVGRYHQGKAVQADCIMTIPEIKTYLKKQSLTIVGDAHLVGLKDQPIDIVEQMFSLLPLGKWEQDVNLVQPQYLKG